MVKKALTAIFDHGWIVRPANVTLAVAHQPSRSRLSDRFIRYQQPS
jgi:hypothetical protein